MVATTKRPDLVGLLVKSPAYGDDRVYLVDLDGVRRWVPSSDVLHALFRPGTPIISDIDAICIAPGDQLSTGAHLAQDESDKKVYLVDGVKRWVTSAAAMNRYSFNYETVDPTKHETLAQLDDGPDIEGPSSEGAV